MTSQHRRPEQRPADPFDEAIRDSLQRRTIRSQPPSDGWQNLRRQVLAGPVRRRRRTVWELQRLLNVAVQGAAAVILVALLGATLTPERAAEPVPTPAPVVAPVVSEAPPRPPVEVPLDMPRRSIVVHSPPAAPLNASSRVDMLNLAALLKLYPAPAPVDYDPALLPVAVPQLDPTLFSHM